MRKAFVKTILWLFAVQIVLLYVFWQFFINSQASSPENTGSVVLEDFHVEIHPGYETTPRVIAICSGDERYLFDTRHQKDPLMSRDEAWERIRSEKTLFIKYVDDINILLQPSHTIADLCGDDAVYLTQNSFNSYRASSRTGFLVIIVLIEIIYLIVAWRIISFELRLRSA